MRSGIQHKADDGRVEISNKRHDWLETFHRGRHQESYDLAGHHILYMLTSLVDFCNACCCSRGVYARDYTHRMALLVNNVYIVDVELNGPAICIRH